MSDEVRTVRVEEFDDFMRFLERCYGHSRDFFVRAYPHIYRPEPEACACCHVVAQDGRIVSHVGVFPIELLAAGAHIPVGGIGGVATLPDQRGKGHMSRLLRHVIGVMREGGCLASGLGGDRQRYNTFGWEMAGRTVHLTFSRRSLEWAKVEPVQVEEKRAAEAVETVARLHTLQGCHTRRTALPLLLRKEGLRIWIADDGYAISSGEGYAHPSMLELVSASGREAGMVLAVLNCTFGSEATWALSAWDGERLARLLPCVSRWTAGRDWMYRVVHLPGLLTACKPVLERRAACLADFDVSIGIHEHDRVDTATIAVRYGCVEISPGRASQTYIELDPVAAARLFFGGPSIGRHEEIPQGLFALLPLPIRVPPLDYV